MFKFLLLMLSLLVGQVINEIIGETKSENIYDTQVPSIVLGTVDNSSEKIPDLGGIHINGTHQIFYINSPAAWKWRTNWSSTDSEIRSDYTARNGIDAHKVHRRRVSWHAARRICVEEGGHLAAIRTKEEMQFVKTLMMKEAVETIWVGFHDLFQEGEWVTVLDEPLAKMEYDPWTKKIPNNPDNAGGKENCAHFSLPADGINDMPCEHLDRFVCKINISCQ